MPAPFYHGSPPPKGPESLSGHVRDLANAFSSAASVLSDQYTTLNKATNGLLDGTDPWQGQGADSFSTAWQAFGAYMQQMQKACEDTYNALNKFANKLSDVEAQQVWDILLTIVGGILTLISVAAAIAEFGLNPFVDGIATFFSGFTEQEGSSVVNAAEEITQADSQAATELQLVETELTTSPTLTGPTDETPGSIPDALSPVSLDDMAQGFNMSNLTGNTWGQFVEEDAQTYLPSGSMEGVTGPDGSPLPNSCSPSSVKMLLADNGITASDQEIMNDIGYNPATGTNPQNAAAGLRQLGLPNATYNRNMTVSDLENAASPTRPIYVGLKLGQAPGSNYDGHAIIVDGIGETDDGMTVLIRDPYYSPPRAYRISLWQFEQVWDHTAITY